MKSVRPCELVEIGSGSSRKTRLLLRAMHGCGGDRYVPFDVSEEAVRSSADALGADFPWLEIHGVIGDFERDLERIPRGAPRVVAFLGSTIGNLFPDDRPPFLRKLRSLLDEGDRLLVGFDLVKDPDVLEAAYDDSRGVTAEFNKNVLRVLNRELDADFDPELFEHVAEYVREKSWIEMRLRASEACGIHVSGLDLAIQFEEGEEMRTEISCKFTREAVEADLARAGLALEAWHTDPGDRFALAVALRT